MAFAVQVSEADETLLPEEDAAEAALRLARLKAESVSPGQALPVLGADTVVVCGGRVLGKPSSPLAAADMLRLLSGRTHEVITGLCLVCDGRTHSGVDRTKVTFATLSEEEIAWYVGTGEPLDKAGAYHVDGRGALFITGVAGSPSNVAGLPIRLFLSLVRASGVRLGLAD